MSATGLPVFDNTVQQTNLWLKSITTKLGVDDRHLAYSLLKGTLHALRDRIGPENAVHLGAQLPILLRGVYYEGWRPTTTRRANDRCRSSSTMSGGSCRRAPISTSNWACER